MSRSASPPIASRLCALLLLACATQAAPAEDGAVLGDVPHYATTAAPETVPRGRLADATRDAIATLTDPPGPEAAQESARVLAGIGEGALPAIVAALRTSPWFTRAALIGAVAEMDTATAGPLLRTAARDPSFAVREAAVTGLGKIGGRADADVLFERADPDREPSWRVRSAATTALRRAALRGAVERRDAEAALADRLLDPDADTRRAALVAIRPFAADAALAALLDVFGDPRASVEARSGALAALRVYRHRPDDITPALRLGFLETDDATAGAAAGAALLDVLGLPALDDNDVAWTVVRRLGDHGVPAMRAALARLGPDVVPWLRARATELTRQIASHRVDHQDSPLEFVVETLLEVRREEGFAVLRELAVGPQAEVLAPATRRFALRKIRILFAPRVAAELRAAFDGHAGDGVRRELLMAIEASGGDDLAARLDSALGHEDSEARSTALDLLTRRPDLPAGPLLLRLAASAEARLRQRELAIEALTRRDPEAAARIARSLLDHPHFDVREKAAIWVGAAARPDDLQRLLDRLATEDGTDARTAERVVPRGTAVTPSGDAPDAAQRRRVRRALLTALRAAAPGEARVHLFQTLVDEGDVPLRERAASLLRGLVDASHAPRLLELLRAEVAPQVRSALQATLATLGDSDVATAHFDALLRSSGRRGEALVLLRSNDAMVRPLDALLAGVEARDWDDDEREAALIVLERHARVPPPEQLVELAREAHERSLTSEALRLTAVHHPEAAGPLLAELVLGLDDLEKLGMVARQIGVLRFQAAVPALIRRLDALHADALAAPRATDPAVDAYRRVAVALGRAGGDAAGEALARHLLHVRTARAVTPFSRAAYGPFDLDDAPPVKALRGVLAAIAHFDEPTCRRLIESRLRELADDASDLRLGEEYVDGIARYLRDPEAYEGLPPRRRPGAALPLMQLVLRTAPRLSPLDVEMQGYIRDQLDSEGRFDDAVSAHAQVVALADVEEAWRPRERRLRESGKGQYLRAMALASASQRDEAIGLLSSLRQAEPTNGDLAYYAGRGLAKLGVADEQAFDAMRHAVLVDERYAGAHLWLGWLTQVRDGPTAAVPHFEEAVRLDEKAVREAGAEYLRTRRGKTHPWADYAYWCARALALAGRTDDAAHMLRQAVLHDDRTALQAVRDAAFADWPERDDVVRAALDTLRESD